MTMVRDDFDKEDLEWQKFNEFMDQVEQGPDGRFRLSKIELENAAQETLNLLRRLRAHPAAEEAIRQLLLNVNIKKGWM